MHSQEAALHSYFRCNTPVTMDSKSNDNVTPNKRNRESENDSDDNDEVDAGVIARMTRSERKCHRERRRRSEVNKGFDDLTSLLWEIDATTMRTEIENRAQRGKKQANLPTEDIFLSRVDLITCTISLLRRLHVENEQLKSVVNTLTQPSRIGSGQNVNIPDIASVSASRDADRMRSAAASVSRDFFIIHFTPATHN
jgi:Helix-loop-helix DNA-binding domain